MTEAPEHHACRIKTTTERRGVEATLGQWRLGDSNWRNLYVGTRHVGVIWEPGLPERVVTAMNDDPAQRIAEMLTDCGLHEAAEVVREYAGNGSQDAHGAPGNASEGDSGGAPL